MFCLYLKGPLIYFKSILFIALANYSIHLQYRVETNCIHYFRPVLLLPGVAVSSMVLPIGDREIHKCACCYC